MSEDLLARPAVARVQAALIAAGSKGRVIALAQTARTAEDAARALGCELGAIVKTLVFAVEGRAVLALVAGDRRCNTMALARALSLNGPVTRADAELVRQATGQSIGGVAPLGHPARLPAAIDASLKRFTTVYAAAGHPHCVFPTSVSELEMVSGALSTEIGE
ncbi:MAG TPA: YbaK/EbsC family protein [Candidatus Cybelea sp.]|nr:YbaK/EbsC family protein [Candidatus Cybelea sp.]